MPLFMTGFLLCAPKLGKWMRDCYKILIYMYTILLTDREYVLYINDWKNKLIYESIYLICDYRENRAEAGSRRLHMNDGGYENESVQGFKQG